MNVFELVATLVLDKKDYDKGLDDSEEKAEGFGGKLKNALATGAKVGGAALAAAGAAAGAMTKAISDGVMETAAYGDNIDKMSQKLGISATAYQEWDAILQHSGTSIESMTGAMKTMQLAAESGSDAFAQLGISQEELANMSTEDMFSAVITGLQEMESGSDRTKLATELLGRGAMELGALLNTSAEDTEAMRQKVHELGGVMSDDAVKASAAYQDSMQDMKTSMDGLKRNMLTNLMPAFTSMMDGLTALFSGDAGSGTEMIIEGIQSIGSGIREALPNIIESGKQIVSGLLQMIVQALPEFLTMGFELIGEMISGISNNMPSIISTLLNVLTQLLTTIVQNLPQFLAQGVQMIVAIIGGLVQATPQIITAIVQVAKSAWEAFKNYDWLSLGSDIINGIVKGVSNMAGSLMNKMSELAKSAWKTVKNFFGIASPSKLMRDSIGKYIPEGMAVGIEANTDSVTSAMKDLGEMAQSAADVSLSNLDMPTIGVEEPESRIGYAATEYGGVEYLLKRIFDKLDGMQIVLDTGTIAGEVTGRIDTRLGALAYAKGIGV